MTTATWYGQGCCLVPCDHRRDAHGRCQEARTCLRCRTTILRADDLAWCASCEALRYAETMAELLDPRPNEVIHKAAWRDGVTVKGEGALRRQRKPCERHKWVEIASNEFRCRTCGMMNERKAL